MQLKVFLLIGFVLNAFCLNNLSGGFLSPKYDLRKNESLLESLKKDPSSFAELFTKADPQKTDEIIDLLEALVAEASAALDLLSSHVTDATNSLNTANSNVQIANNNVQICYDDVHTANENLDAAQVALDLAETDHSNAVIDQTNAVNDQQEAQSQKDLSDQNYAEQSPALIDEQEVLQQVIDSLGRLKGPCSSGNDAVAYAVANEVAACEGSFSGNIRASTLCSQGWHVCNGRDIYSHYQITAAMAQQIPRCFAYDSMNDCNGCWEHCEDNAVELKPGCLDSGAGHDLTGMGSGCNLYPSNPACIQDARSNIVGYDRSGCVVNSVPSGGGVMCCIGSSYSNEHG